MTITIREVAVAAGVSRATAARALSGYGSVSPGALERVIVAADELGYRPNRLAQALRLGQTKTVGFIPGDLESPFFATVTRHLADALEASGFTLLVSSSDERSERERRIIETMRSHQVSSFVIAPSSSDDSRHLRALTDAEIPLVLIDRTIPGIEADSVTVDNVAGSRQAVEHLHALGHRSIAILSDDLAIDSSLDRLRGFREAAREFGYSERNARVQLAPASREGAYDGARRVLEADDRATGVFAADSTMTVAVLRASADLGISVPDRLSLVGFDDFDLAQAFRPTVTTIAQPVAAVGVAAAELLIKRLGGATTPYEHVRLATDLIVRQSSGPAPS